jgi:hypothetical protein
VWGKRMKTKLSREMGTFVEKLTKFILERVSMWNFFIALLQEHEKYD